MVNLWRYQRISESKGSIVITMDADLQDDPNEIIPLYNMVKNGVLI